MPELSAPEPKTFTEAANRETWIDIKREYEISQTGERWLTKVSMEEKKRKYLGLEKRDALDLLLRCIGLLAIFIPIYTYFLQQNSQVTARKAEAKLSLYASVTTEIHNIVDRSLSDKDEQATKARLFYDLYPKLVMQGDEKVVRNVGMLKNLIPLYSFILSITPNIDTFNSYANYLYKPIIMQEENPNPLLFKIGKKKYPTVYNSMVILHDSLIDMREILYEEFVTKDPYDTAGLYAVKKYAGEERILLNNMIKVRGYFITNLQNMAGSKHNDIPNAKELVAFFTNLDKELKIKTLELKDFARRFKVDLINYTRTIDSSMLNDLYGKK
jgi:hypothetical protein